MKKTVACIIARTVSQRLPLKVLRQISPNETMLEFLIGRLKLVQNIDEIYLCTSRETVDDILEDVAEKTGIKIYRGDSLNILERMMSVGELENADFLIRITGDNPLTSYEFIDQQIDLIDQFGLDYVRVIDVPIGSTAEVMTYEALKRCSTIMNPVYSEYLMLYLFEPNEFNCGVLKPFKEDYSGYSITVDTPEDLQKIRSLLIQPDPVKVKLSEILPALVNKKHELSRQVKSEEPQIKLPENQSIPLSEFLLDMERRKAGSRQFDIA